MHGYVLQDGRERNRVRTIKYNTEKSFVNDRYQYSFLRLSEVAKSVEYSWEYSIRILVSDIFFPQFQTVCLAFRLYSRVQI